jgi:hypothetical protein
MALVNLALSDQAERHEIVDILDLKYDTPALLPLTQLVPDPERPDKQPRRSSVKR